MVLANEVILNLGVVWDNLESFGAFPKTNNLCPFLVNMAQKRLGQHLFFFYPFFSFIYLYFLIFYDSKGVLYIYILYVALNFAQVMKFSFCR